MTTDLSVWLDDERDPSNPLIQKEFGAKGNEIWVKTASEAIDLLSNGNVINISLDHDLGLDDGETGYDVAKYIEEHSYLGNLPKLSWRIHSQNVVGVQKMICALTNADKYWKR